MVLMYHESLSRRRQLALALERRNAGAVQPLLNIDEIGSVGSQDTEEGDDDDDAPPGSAAADEDDASSTGAAVCLCRAVCQAPVLHCINTHCTMILHGSAFSPKS